MPPVQILPSARPHPFAGQNAAAFKKILETLGNFETLRRKRMLSSDILGVLQSGGSIEDIAAVAQRHQTPSYSAGLPGVFQRIATPFAQQPGMGITDMLLKGTAEQAFKTISPSQLMAGERWRKYQEAVATGDTETADKLLSSALVNVKIGGQPWRAGFLGQEAMGLEADIEHKEKVGLSTAEGNRARQSVKTIIKEIPEEWLSTWFPGRFNMRREPLIEGYKHYQTETNYKSKSFANRKILDDIWDSQMNLYNTAGYKKMGKGEFDWDPKDPQVQELRAVEGIEDTPTKPPEEIPEESEIIPKEEPAPLPPIATLEERKKKAARKARIRSWVVPFNKKYGKRLQPSVLDKMDDEYIDWLNSLSSEERELELKKISGKVEPESKTEFINELRRLNIADPNAAKKYYEQYLDKFW